MENGYHAQLRAFLQKAYHSYQLFLEFPDVFEKLKRAPFWEISRQRPKDLTTSRWVLLIIMQAKTSNVRVRASKYAKILDKFARAGIKVAQVANRIKKLGGVEAAYKRIVAAEQHGPTRQPMAGWKTSSDRFFSSASCVPLAEATQKFMASRWRSKRNRIP